MRFLGLAAIAWLFACSGRVSAPEVDGGADVGALARDTSPAPDIASDTMVNEPPEIGETGIVTSVCADAGGAPANGDGGACNAVEHHAPWVDARAATGALPYGKGGAVVEGTYVLTAVDAYPGSSGYAPTGPTGRFRQSLVLRGGCLETIASVSESVGYHASGSFRVVGSRFHVTYACPSWIGDVSDYDASPSGLVLYEIGGYASGVARRFDRIGP